MKKIVIVTSTALLLCAIGHSAEEASAGLLRQSIQLGSTQVSPASPASDDTKMADKRFEEMLDRMQAAVEEVAQLYGNPIFLQVFTNDVSRAAELKQRLKTARTDEEIVRELTALEKKRDDLRGDIALKERESARLTAKLVHQREALDSLAAAVDQARRVVEDTTK